MACLTDALFSCATNVWTRKFWHADAPNDNPSDPHFVKRFPVVYVHVDAPQTRLAQDAARRASSAATPLVDAAPGKSPPSYNTTTAAGPLSGVARAQAAAAPALWPGCQATDAVECPRVPASALPPRPVGHVRFVCVSDTHDLHWSVPVPPGDVFVHAGDILVGSKNLSRDAAIKKYKDFNAWLGALPHSYKFVVGGNHDCYLDPENPRGMEISDVRALLSNATFLHNEDAYIPNNACDATTKGDLGGTSVVPATTLESALIPPASLTSKSSVGTPGAGLRIFGTSFSYGVSGNAAFQARHDAGRGDAIVAMAKTTVGGGDDTELPAVPSPAAAAAPTPPVDVFISHHAIHPRCRGDPITEAVLGAAPIARVHVGGHFHEWYGATRHPIPCGGGSGPSEVVTVCACSVDGRFNLNRGAVIFDLASLP